MAANNSNEHNFQQKMRLRLNTRNVFVGIFEFKMKLALEISLSSELLRSTYWFDSLIHVVFDKCIGIYCALILKMYLFIVTAAYVYLNDLKMNDSKLVFC